MSIKVGNLEAVAYHLEQGQDNGGITQEALALFLRGTADEVKRLEAENERLTEALRRLFIWTAAYPLDVFPEPDLEQVAAVLKAAGLTLDAVSASNMRFVLAGVVDTLREAGVSSDES